MTSLQDLVTDYINDAKSAQDSQSKLFVLEQIKEVVLHRDVSIIKNVAAGIFDLIVDKSISVRLFLLKLGSQLMKVDGASVFPYFLNMVHFLVSDTNEKVLLAVSKDFQHYHNKLVSLISTMPIAVTKTTQTLTDPRYLWQQFKTIKSRLHEFITSTRSDALKLNCMRLYETEIVFGLIVPAASVVATSDPRLKKVDPRLAAKTAAGQPSSTEAGVTAEIISLHHPVINRCVGCVVVCRT